MLLFKVLICSLAVVPDSVMMLLARLLNLFFYPGVLRGRWRFVKVAKVLPKLFPESDENWRRETVCRNALHILKLAAETLKARTRKRRASRRKCYIGSGEARFRRLLDSGKGFVVLTGHVGNFEYGAAYIAMNFRRVHALVEVSDTPGSRLLNWAREGHNVELLESKTDPRASARTLLAMIRLLNRGEILFLVADQRGRGGDVEGTLFGKRLKFFGGPFLIGKRTGVPFLPLMCLRDERNRIALHFEEPFHLNGDDPEGDMKKVTGFFERMMREHPDQYLWSRDRW